MTDPRVKVTVGIPTFNRAGLLRESMASVLAQTYGDMRLLVCDNASDDDTQETVASFADPRIEYVRSDENIGRDENFNRIIELAETEFLVILPDDDILYPDYLRCAIEAVERYPSVGVVHTAFDLIDGSSRVLEHARTLLRFDGPMSIESGEDFLERSMSSSWTVCWSSALFRTRAIAEAQGLRIDEQPLADVSLYMRIARDWNFACLSRSLVAFRLHADAATAALGSYTGFGYDLLEDQPQILYDRRMRFLDEARLPVKRTKHYRSIAAQTLRRDELRRLANQAGAGARWMSTTKALIELVRADPRKLLLPVTWRLCAAQLGGRNAKRAAGWLRGWINSDGPAASPTEELPP